MNGVNEYGLPRLRERWTPSWSITSRNKWLRRSAALLLIVLTAATMPVSAPQATAVQPGSTLENMGPLRVHAGEPIELTLRLKHSRDVAAYETALLFDTSAAEFSSLQQNENDLKKLGRDVGSLAVVEVSYGAAIGFYSCPISDCVTRRGNSQRQGGNGTVTLATVVLATSHPGTLEIALGASKVVDVTGTAAPVTLATPSLSVVVEVASPVYPAPSSPWSLPPSVSGAQGPVDLTSDGQVSNADAMEVALAWERLREEGRACGELPEPDQDVNRDGCIDVSDLQLVAANYSEGDAAITETSADGAQRTQAAIGSTFVVNATGDQVDATRGDGVCATSVGTCTLRAAIMASNQRFGPDTIAFNLPGSGVQTIQLAKTLPSMLDETGGRRSTVTPSPERRLIPALS